MARFSFFFSKTPDGAAVRGKEQNILKIRVAKIATKKSDRSGPNESSPQKNSPSHFIPIKPRTSVTLINGKRYEARIVDIWRYGVVIETDIAKAKDIVLIGSTKVEYIKRVRAGAAFKFLRPLGFKSCNSQHVL